ncbi:hypothetical protein JOF48_001553 [Arthrobacter stackebrandtii]|uniref:Uncharacterized protein n=1 Tax=Arthrobacter stackebrandtii TaxID=272161 RepID=A0ABS4YVK1_9MICC|nr:hypothetical protein [Arthrobacter stackebrandtii]
MMAITHRSDPNHPHGRAGSGGHAPCEQPVLTSTGCFI